MINRFGTDGIDNLFDDGSTVGQYIHGMGGDDLIYAGLGNDTIHGGAGNDTIAASTQTNSSVRGWGYDTVLGGQDNDTLYFSNTTNDLKLYGDDKAHNVRAGNDTIYSGSGNDYIVGGLGKDEIWGGAGADQIWGDLTTTFASGGNDTLFGGAGKDSIWGGAGDDRISGGTGQDTLWGNQGSDKFVVGKGDSNIGLLNSDRVQDFQTSFDRIVLNRSGTTDLTSWSNNYSETTITNRGSAEANYAAALKVASDRLARTDDYVFVTDGKNGYLFVDMDSDFRVDTGILLVGMDQLSDFSAKSLEII